eukprot:gb/GEZN01004013.1/.p1 GENE.gb/GEZN01004013.1/~~gb/GEZN01004013.1/.p1  ORF type:complete len:312 (+),score=10.48 gb/GEZN01004013.1/:398-1333(+)
MFWPELLILLLLRLGGVHGSVGDQDPAFQHCVNVCERTKCQDPALSKLPLLLELTFWTCPENCRYDCMHNITQQRSAYGLPILKYYGKWPFVRILGMQELASVVFSIANAVPNLILYRRFGRPDLRRHRMTPVWRCYSLAAINTWVWSTVFHARDFFLTERLDYYFSANFVYASAWASVIYTQRVRSWFGRLTLTLATGAMWLSHIGYLHYVHMDYGLHVQISICLFVMYIGLWLSYAWAHWQSHTWQLVLSLGITLAAAAMEVGDFPPFLGLFDAHSLWHGCTPFSAYLMFRFLVQDMTSLIEREKRSAA